MDPQTQFIPRDLGITEGEAMRQLEQSGSHEVRGFIASESGRIYYDVMTERSDVSVTTAAVGDRSQIVAKSPNDITGYRTFVGTNHRGVFFETTNRAVVKQLHEFIVAEARLGGTQHALLAGTGIARSLGIEAYEVGVGPIALPERKPR